MVRIQPDPPSHRVTTGGLAQLGERLLCKQEVVGSIPSSSTIIVCIKESVWLFDTGFVGKVRRKTRQAVL